jgi:hypothetical protein
MRGSAHRSGRGVGRHRRAAACELTTLTFSLL